MEEEKEEEEDEDDDNDEADGGGGGRARGVVELDVDEALRPQLLALRRAVRQLRHPLNFAPTFATQRVALRRAGFLPCTVFIAFPLVPWLLANHENLDSS